MALIERSAVIEVLKNSAKDIKRCVKEDDHYFVDWYADGLAKRVEQLPAVDAVEVRHGHWIYWRDSKGVKHCKCSECITSYGCIDTPYCPQCGALMDGKDEA